MEFLDRKYQRYGIEHTLLVLSIIIDWEINC